MKLKWEYLKENMWSIGSVARLSKEDGKVILNVFMHDNYFQAVPTKNFKCINKLDIGYGEVDLCVPDTNFNNADEGVDALKKACAIIEEFVQNSEETILALCG